MSKPLIDRDALAQAMRDHWNTDRAIDENETADAVVAYLRTVITPEALWYSVVPEAARQAAVDAIFGDTDNNIDKGEHHDK